MSKTSTMKLAI